jgi:hypothetical protein
VKESINLKIPLFKHRNHIPSILILPLWLRLYLSNSLFWEFKLKLYKYFLFLNACCLTYPSYPSWYKHLHYGSTVFDSVFIFLLLPWFHFLQIYFTANIWGEVLNYAFISFFRTRNCNNEIHMDDSHLFCTNKAISLKSRQEILQHWYTESCSALAKVCRK